MSKQLILDSKQFKIEDVSGLTPAICKTLASIGLLDEIITLDEYVILSNASKSIAQISGNPLLVNSLTLHFILNPVNFKLALKELSLAVKEFSPEDKEIIFTVMNEVIALQGKQSKKIQSDVAHALGVDEKNISKQAKEIVGSFSKTISSKLVFKQSRLEKIKEFARIYNHNELENAVKGMSKDEHIDNNVEKIIKESKSTISSALSEFENSNKLHPDYEDAVNQLNELSEAMIEQVRNRLGQITDRIKLEKEIFEEDFNSFLEDTALEC